MIRTSCVRDSRRGKTTYDVEIGSQVGRHAVVRRNPVTRSGGTAGIGDYVRAVPLQNGCVSAR